MCIRDRRIHDTAASFRYADNSPTDRRPSGGAMDHQPNDPRTGLEFYDLSATFGHNAPLWPYFEDVKIERMHYHAKSGVLSPKITTGMHGPVPLLPGVVKEYEQLKGHPIQDDFPDWEPCHRLILGNGMVGFENVCGADIDKVTGKRVTIAAFPWRWEKGDGCIVRIVAIVDPTGEFRLATGKER